MKIRNVLGVLTIILMCSFIPSDSSEAGISFVDANLEQAMEMAKEQDKLIFIDVYTTWCGPCKRMAATSFKDEKVAKKYNGQFINLKLDAEKSDDGKFVARSYRIQGYPTLLFINHKGKLIKQTVGLQSADDLLNVASGLLVGAN
jgi:thioredoxin 1